MFKRGFLVALVIVSSLAVNLQTGKVVNLMPQTASAIAPTFTINGAGNIRTFVNTVGGPLGYTHISDNYNDAAALHWDIATATKICQMAGYSNVASYDCYDTGAGRCGWYSCGDNGLATWNGTNFVVQNACSLNNTWMANITCTTPIPPPQCSDGIDNDLDGAADYPADFSCSSATDNDETNPRPQCNDGIDNDLDGVTDANDPGCSGTQDNSENTATTQCQDGADNDADTLTDANDPGCHSDFNRFNTASYVPIGNNEASNSGKGTCANGRDDNNNTTIDAQDPICHTDGNAGNNASFDPNKNETAPTGSCSEGAALLNSIYTVINGGTDSYTLNQSKTSAYCNGTDMLLSGAGTAPSCDSFANNDPACNRNLNYEFNGFTANGSQLGWTSYYSTQDDAAYDTVREQVMCVPNNAATTKYFSTYVRTSGPITDYYSVNQNKTTAYCDAGDLAIGGGGTNVFCDTTGNGGCANQMLEFNGRIVNGSQEGWLVNYSVPGDATYDTIQTTVVCLKKTALFDQTLRVYHVVNEASPIDYYSLDQNRTIALCNPGDVAIAGGGNAAYCDNSSNPACGKTQYLEMNKQVTVGGQQGWQFAFDLLSNGLYDTERSEVTCIGVANTCTGNTTPQCSDNVDNDGDNLADANDPGCHTDFNRFNSGSYNANGTNEASNNGHGTCADGADNNGNGLIDSQDPICHSDGIANNQGSFDPNRNEIVAPNPQCSDGTDNDADTLVDSNDPGCHSDFNRYNNASYVASGTNEASNNGHGTCADGIDNNSNSLIDAQDPSCHTDGNAFNQSSFDPNRNEIAIQQCQDGADNDADTLVDSNDPGCHTDLNRFNTASYVPGGSSESNNSGHGTCADGIDNNSNSLIDAQDPSCHTDGNTSNLASFDPSRNETAVATPQCSDGTDNDADTLVDSNDPGCHTDFNRYNTATYNSAGTSEASNNGHGNCADGIDNNGNNLIDAQDPQCHTDGVATNTASFDANRNETTVTNPQCSDGTDNDADTLVDSNDPGCHTDFNRYNSATYTASGTSEASNNGHGTCADGIDNNSNSLVDAQDPLCHTDGNSLDTASFDANRNETSTTTTQCSDAIDNDGDFLVDSNDPGCHTDYNRYNSVSYNAAGTSEVSNSGRGSCSDGIDNNGNGLIDAQDPLCHTDGNTSNTSSFDPNRDETQAVTCSNSTSGYSKTITPMGPSYVTYTTVTFNLNAGSHTFMLRGKTPVGNADNTALIDSIVLQGSSLNFADNSFESAITGSYQYTPTGTPWTFTTGAGISGNNSGFTSANPVAPAGNQVAFIQNGGSISQALTLPAGTYSITFKSAQRGTTNDQNGQTLDLLIDGSVANTCSTGGSSSSSTSTATDLAVTLSGPTSVVRGGTVTYTATVINNGPAVATNITLTDPPAGFILLSAQSSNGCVQNGSVVTCTLASLAVGASQTFTLTFSTSNSNCGISVTDVATVSASNADTNTSNNQSSTVSTTVSCSGTGSQCQDGVDNDSDALIDIADPDCHTDNNAQNNSSYDPNRTETNNNGGQTCRNGRDDDNDGMIDMYDPDCHTDGNVNNSYTYDGSRSENSGNNGTCNSSDLDIQAKAIDNFVAPGDDLEYEITITNDGNTSCAVDLHATLDNQTTFRFASSGGDERGNDEVLWSNFVLSRHDDRTVRLTVRVDRGANDGDTLTMKASIPNHNDRVSVEVREDGSNGSSSSNGGSNSSTRLSVSKVADRSTAQPGDIVSYTVTIRNMTSSSVSNVTVDDIYNSGQLSILDPAGGTVNGSTLRWNLDRIDGNTTRTLRYTARISTAMRNGDIVQNNVTVNGSGSTGTDSNVIRIITQLPQTGVGFGSMMNGSDSTHLQAVAAGQDTGSASNAVSLLSILATVIGGLGVGGSIGRKLLFS